MFLFLLLLTKAMSSSLNTFSINFSKLPNRVQIWLTSDHMFDVSQMDIPSILWDSGEWKESWPLQTRFSVETNDQDRTMSLLEKLGYKNQDELLELNQNHKSYSVQQLNEKLKITLTANSIPNLNQMFSIPIQWDRKILKCFPAKTSFYVSNQYLNEVEQVLELWKSQ